MGFQVPLITPKMNVAMVPNGGNIQLHIFFSLVRMYDITCFLFSIFPSVTEYI